MLRRPVLTHKHISGINMLTRDELRVCAGCSWMDSPHEWLLLADLGVQRWRLLKANTIH